MKKLIYILLFIPVLAGAQTLGTDYVKYVNGFQPTPTLSNIQVTDITYTDTYWLDATVSAYSLASGVQAPSLRTIKGAIEGIGFNYQTANDIVHGQVQFNHNYKLGTDIECHLHWLVDDAPAGGNDTVVIMFVYSWADINEAFPTADTTITEIVIDGKTAFTHYLTEIVDPITGSGGDGLSSSLVFTLHRLQDDASDTFPDWWILLDVDFHYEIDTPGSQDELSK